VSKCKKVHNVTGGRWHGWMKSLHTLTVNASLKSVSPGSDYSTNNGEMPITVIKHGVFPCWGWDEKRKNQNKDADVTIWYTSTENHLM
jgi:hypothetical protein